MEADIDGRSLVRTRFVLMTVALALTLAACGGGSTSPRGAQRNASTAGAAAARHTNDQHATSTPTPVPHQSPVAPEVNPPGDIPDNTQFVPYTSKPGGFTVTVPEGWSRKTHGSSVSFSDKLNTITLSWQPAKKAPSVSSAKANDVPELQSAQPAFRLQSVRAATLPAGKAVLIDYQANSKPNG